MEGRARGFKVIHFAFLYLHLDEKGTGDYEYSSSNKSREMSKERVDYGEVIDFSYGQEAPDPLLVCSLLGSLPDGSKQTIGVLYLSVVDLIKRPVVIIYQGSHH